MAKFLAKEFRLSPISVTFGYFGAVLIGALCGSLIDEIFSVREKDIAAYGFDLLQVLATFVLFLFGLKLFELFVITKDQKELAEEARRLTEKSKGTTEIIAQLSDAFGRIAIGREEHSEKNVHGALALAEDVITDLEQRRKEYTDDSQIIKALDRAVMQALDLKAGCLFDMRNYGPILDVANKLVALSDENWRGYHWMGIYYLAIEPSRDNTAKARQSLERSVEIQKVGNRDSLNLPDLYLRERDYHKVREYADDYLRSSHGARDHSELPPNRYLILAKFYLTLAEFAESGNSAIPKAFRAKFDRTKGKVRSGGFFDGRVLRQVLSDAKRDGRFGNAAGSECVSEVESLIIDFCEWAEND